jgi:3-oxoacyl-[acyl-carrier protein] reductase
MEKLSGKTALVTGASRGIGRASALALAASGAQLRKRR